MSRVSDKGVCICVCASVWLVTGEREERGEEEGECETRGEDAVEEEEPVAQRVVRHGDEEYVCMNNKRRRLSHEPLGEEKRGEKTREKETEKEKEKEREEPKEVEMETEEQTGKEKEHGREEERQKEESSNTESSHSNAINANVASTPVSSSKRPGAAQALSPEERVRIALQLPGQ